MSEKKVVEQTSKAKSQQHKGPGKWILLMLLALLITSGMFALRGGQRGSAASLSPREKVEDRSGAAQQDQIRPAAAVTMAELRTAINEATAQDPVLKNRLLSKVSAAEAQLRAGKTTAAISSLNSLRAMVVNTSTRQLSSVRRNLILSEIEMRRTNPYAMHNLPKGWEVCGAGCNKPAEGDEGTSTKKIWCVSSSACTGHGAGCACSLFGVKKGEDHKDDNWEHFATPPDKWTKDDEYEYRCMCVKAN
jgi:hypothetical protein